MNNEYNDANSYKCYVVTREEILKRKTIPFSINNEPLADYYFAHFHKEFPSARMLKFEGTQYICYDDRAVKKLKKHMENRLSELHRKEKSLSEFLKKL